MTNTNDNHAANPSNVPNAAQTPSNPPSDSMPTNSDAPNNDNYQQLQTPAPMIPRSTSDISILKHFGVNLKLDGSNMESYLYKMERILTSKNLMSAVTIHFDDDENSGETIRANPFKDRHMLPQLADLTQTEVDNYVTTMGIDPMLVQSAHTMITITMPDDLLHVYRNYANHAAVTLARIREHFFPTDVKTVHELHNKINHCKLTQYGDDFSKMAETLKTCAHKLHQLGERVTERYLVGRLLDGLVPYHKYTVIRSIVEQQGDVPFSAAVASINSYLRSHSLSRKRTPASPESAMQLKDERYKQNQKYYNKDLARKLRNKAALRKLATKRKRQERIIRQLKDRLNTKRFKQRTCNVCGKPGHKPADCHHNPHRGKTCHKCGIRGHIARDCFTNTKRIHNKNDQLKHLQEELKNIKTHLQEAQKNKLHVPLTTDNNDTTNEIIDVMVESNPVSPTRVPTSGPSLSPTVIFDSGASSMFFNKKEYFISLQKIPRKKILTGKQNSTLTADYRGVVPLLVGNGNGQYRRMTVDALYVPNAPENYFSQLSLDRHGYEIRCKNGTISIYLKDSLIAIAKQKGKSYHLLCKIDQDTLLNPERINTLTLSPYEAHVCLGHLSPEKLKDTIKATNGIKLKGKMPKTFHCLACDLTKTKRSSTPRADYKLSRHNPQRAHSDVKFPITTSLRGFRGFVVYLMEGSRHVSVGLIKQKSDVEEKSIKHINNLITSKKPLTEFRSDGGGEHLSNYFQEHLQSKGISFTRSTPRTPNQNGKAERIIQSLMNMVRSMLQHAHLPHGYWCYALEHAVYTYNRSTHSALQNKSTPFEIENGRKPNMEGIIPFGCIGVTAIDAAERPPGGLSKRGHLVRMLSYDKRHKTYIVCDQNPKLVYRRRVSKWYKNKFTFPSIAPSANEEKVPRPPTTKPNATVIPLSVRPHRSAKNLAGLPKLGYYDLQRQRIALERASKNVVNKRPRNIANLACLTHDDSICIMKASSASIHDIEDIPKNYKDAMSRSDRDKWHEAHLSELRSFMDNKVFTIIKKPKDAKPVRCRWVYKKKVTASGSIKYKARLVACGYNQEYGVNYFETYTPTLALATFRVLLAMASAKKLKVHSIDVNNAFLTGPLDCVVYMVIPPGLTKNLLPPQQQTLLESTQPICLALNKGVYGLVQAGNMYWTHFKNHVCTYGFQQIYTDPCVLIKKLHGRQIIIACYVDDINILYRVPKDLEWTMKMIGKTFKFKNLGDITLCLGLQIGRRHDGNYWISQTNYINRMAEKFGVLPGKRARSPLPCKNLREYASSPSIDASHYRSIIGAILYTSVATRPDVSYAVSFLATFSQDPREIHLDAAMHLLRYLANTSHYRLLYNGKIRKPNAYYIENSLNGQLTLGFCDASFHPNPDNGKSVSGFVVFVHGGPVCWRKINQKIVTTSSAEAEYVAMSSACKEIIFVRQLCYEINYPENNPTDLLSDSNAAISIATNVGFTQRSKSIRLHYHNTRDCVQNSIVKLKKVDGKENPADALTKSLNRAETSKYAQYFFDTKCLDNETLSYLVETPTDDPQSDDQTQHLQPQDDGIVMNVSDDDDEDNDDDLPLIEASSPEPPHPDQKRQQSRVRQRETDNQEVQPPSPTRQRTSPPPITRQGLRYVTRPDHKNYRYLTMPLHQLPSGLRSSVSSVRSTFSTHRLTQLHIGGYHNVQDLLRDTHHLERKVILDIFLNYDDSESNTYLSPTDLSAAPWTRLVPARHQNFSYITTDFKSLPLSLRTSIDAVQASFRLHRQWLLQTYGMQTHFRQINESYTLERNAMRSLLLSYNSPNDPPGVPHPPIMDDTKSTQTIPTTTMNQEPTTGMGINATDDSSQITEENKDREITSPHVAPPTQSSPPSPQQPITPVDNQQMPQGTTYSTLNRSRQWLSDNCSAL